MGIPNLLTYLKLPNQYDFLPRLLRLSTANILSSLVVPLAGTISIAFLGHLSEIRYLTGVALATILFDGLYYIFLFLRQGTTGVTAQAVGRNDRQAMLLVALRNILIALGLGILILIVQYPLREMGFALLNSTPEVKAEGITYFDVVIWGTPAVLLNYVLIGWLLGREESNSVLLLSFLGSAIKVGLDYLLIIHWGWATTGAGVSQVISQYLMLLGGLIFFCRQLRWQELGNLFQQVWDLSAIKSTFLLNGNLLSNTLVVVFAFTLFSVNSTTMGTTIFAENALLMQILYLGFYLFEGLGFSIESLVGNFKGKKEKDKLVPLLISSALTNLTIGLTFAFLSAIFPATVFGLLTDHAELIEQINVYVWWLIAVLGFASVSITLEGYFLGLTEGHTIRNVSILCLVIGFLPIYIVAWQLHNNHLLWMSMATYYLTGTVSFFIQLPRTLRDNDQADSSYLTENKVI